MGLLSSYLWHPQSGKLVGDVWLEDNAPLTPISGTSLTLGQAYRQFGAPVIDSSLLGQRNELLWPQSGIRVPYTGMLHDLRWWSPLEIQIQNGSSGPVPSTPGTSASPWPWILGGAALLAVIVAYANRSSFT